MKTLRIALLIAGVLVGSLAPVSYAAADVAPTTLIQVVSKYVYGAPNRVVSGTVSCPAGMRMVSSGAGATSVTGIAPVAGFTSAQASGYPLSVGYLRIDVGCLPAAQLTETTSRSTLFPAGTSRGVVTCPPGMRAFGGGGYLSTRSGSMSLADAYTASNTVTADGTGWTVKIGSNNTTDRLVITTQCAPLRGSYVAADSVPMVGVGGQFPSGQLYGSCRPGYMALSGGVYLSKADGTEHDGTITWSIPAGVTSWYVSGSAFPQSDSARIVALEQCIPVT